MKLAKNPIPMKAAAHILSLIYHEDMRLPLVRLQEVKNGHDKYQQLMRTIVTYDLLPVLR